MELKVVLVECFDPNKVNFSKLRTNRSGHRKNSFLIYNDSPFYLVLTDTNFPCGAVSKSTTYISDQTTVYPNKPPGDKIGEPERLKEYWAIICELGPEQLEKFQKLDQLVIDYVLGTPEILASLNLKDPRETINKEQLREKVTAMYSGILKKETLSYPITDHFSYGEKCSKTYRTDRRDVNSLDLDQGRKIPNDEDVKYQNTLKINIASNRGTGFMCTFFDQTRPQSVNGICSDRKDPKFIKNLLTPGSKGAVLFGLSLWVSSNGFGVNLQAEQIKVEQFNTEQEEICFLDL